MAAWPTPTNVWEVQAFLRFSNYYRQFIKNYSKITAPLIDLIKLDKYKKKKKEKK